MEAESDVDVDWLACLGRWPGSRARTLVAEAQGEARLFGHLRTEHEREGRESYVEILAPLELYALARGLRPTHVLEVGVSSGVSSAYILQALDRNGRGTLHSIDLPKLASPPRPGARPPRSSWSIPPGRSSGWAVPLRLRGRWDLRLGNKRDVLPLLAAELGSIEMVVYDVPHDDSVTRREFRALDPLLSSGGVVIVDHGPGGGECAALREWALRRGGTVVGRHDGGLFGFRAGRAATRRGTTSA